MLSGVFAITTTKDKIMSTTDNQRPFKNTAALARFLNYRKKARSPLAQFTCVGGPFHLKPIMLTQGKDRPSTLDNNVTGQRGRYTVRMIDDEQNRRIAETLNCRDYGNQLFWEAK
jgi:hypothetical protein